MERQEHVKCPQAAPPEGPPLYDRRGPRARLKSRLALPSPPQYTHSIRRVALVREDSSGAQSVWRVLARRLQRPCLRAMGLLSIIKKVKAKEREMRILMVYVPALRACSQVND